jgi:DNA polymerase-3 subunit delta
LKAKPYQIDALSDQIKNTFAGALVHGLDVSVIQDVATQIALKIVPALNDDFNVIKLAPQKLKDTPSFLVDEGNAVSFFGGRKLIWLQETDAHSLEAVTLFLDNLKTDAFLLVTSATLNRSSPLRAMFDNQKNTLSVACYTDEERDVKQNIAKYLSDHGIMIAPGVLQTLVSLLSENRNIVKSEIDKLITYLGDKKTVSENDVYAIISDSSSSSIDALCQYVASGQQTKTDKAYAQLLAAGELPASMVRYLLTYFNNLLIGKELLENKTPIEDVLKKILRANQFKLEPMVKSQLQFWKKQHLIKVLDLLLDTEKQTKSSLIPADLALGRTLTLIAHIPAKRNK